MEAYFMAKFSLLSVKKKYWRERGKIASHNLETRVSIYFSSHVNFLVFNSMDWGQSTETEKMYSEFIWCSCVYYNKSDVKRILNLNYGKFSASLRGKFTNVLASFEECRILIIWICKQSKDSTSHRGLLFHCLSSQA